MHLTPDQADDKDLIRYFAGQAFHFPITSVERLNGEMAYNYEVNHRYILKLPSDKTNPDDWLRQGQYMRVLQDKLSYQIPQPVITTVYDKDSKTPFISSSYEKIKGYCIPNTFLFAQKTNYFKMRFFEQLAQAVHQIHSVVPTKLPFELPTKPEILEKYFFARQKSQPTYYQKKMFKKLAHNSILGLGKSAEKTSILTHSDLHCGNVVLNDNNKLVGLLDFDTLARGDYFWEFRPLLYYDPSDTLLFQKIYTRNTGIQIDPCDTERIHQFKSTLQWLAILYRLSNTLTPKKEKQFLKQEIKKRRRLQNVLNTQTGQR